MKNLSLYLVKETHRFTYFIDYIMGHTLMMTLRTITILRIFILNHQNIALKMKQITIQIVMEIIQILEENSQHWMVILEGTS